MSKMIQVKNVPDDVHRTLKARAAHAGMTLSDYVLKALSDLASRPTLDEVLDRLEARGRVGKRFDSAAAVRAEREARR
jgi:antitoxin FitA